MNEQLTPVPIYTDPTQPASVVPWWSVSADLLLKLAFVLILIYVSLWLLRRFTQPGARRPGSLLVNIVEQTTLAPGRAIYLLELGNRLLLIGSTANQISTLAEITDPAEVAELQELRQSEQGPTPAFATQLRSLLDRHTGQSASGETESRDASRPVGSR